MNQTIEPVSRDSGARTRSPFKASHFNFSHVTNTSPKIASVSVLPLSRTATRAIVAWLSTTNRSITRMSLRRCAKELVAHCSCAARQRATALTTSAGDVVGTVPRSASVQGSQHRTTLWSSVRAAPAASWALRSNFLAPVGGSASAGSTETRGT